MNEIKEQINDQMIKDYLIGSNTKLTDNQFIMFLNMAKSFNLNPFKREIYAIAYGNTMNIVTGYQTYIERANDTGLLDGRNTDIIYKDDGKIQGAKITIYRKDWKMPFIWEVNIREFAKIKSDGSPQGVWGTMPEFMIKKIAIGQGFRLAFPSQLGGMPYLSEEITSEKENIPEIKKDITKEGITIQEIKDIAEKAKIDIKEGMNHQCTECGELIFKSVYEQNGGLCIKCYTQSKKNDLLSKITS